MRANVTLPVTALAVILASLGVALLATGSRRTAAPEAAGAVSSDSTIELSAGQLSSVKVEPVGTYLFSVEKEAVGNIDYDGDHSVQVFPPYQGRILETLVALGDEVRQGQPLYTIDSPDLIQAESALLGASASFELATKELSRVRDLYATGGGLAQKEVEQAQSDQQTAEGAFKAARDALRVFGKTELEIDRIAATRQIDPALVVRSPVAGKVTSRNAQPGLFVQPGVAPAPYFVADVSTKWMLANVPESESPLYHVGQPVAVTVVAYPDSVLRGRVTKVYANVDPNTHRVTIRSAIADPADELRPGMFANFTIRVQEPKEGIAIPVTGVVREGDGTLTVWATTDRRHFVERHVKVGLQDDGRYQVLAGLRRGELVVTEGGVFLSNMLQAPPTD